MGADKMPKENKRTRRYPNKHTEPLKLNYKLIAFSIILLASVIIRLMPVSQIKTGFENLMFSTTDYPGMFSEITEVIKRHTFASDSFVFPVNGDITSPFGKRTDPITAESSEHFGIDINAPLNTEVKASKNGTVIKAETNNYYGNFVIIAHNDGLSTLYGHLNEILVKPGEEIKDSGIIGLSGDSGRTTGPHLHFEVRLNNTPVDPLSYLKK